MTASSPPPGRARSELARQERSVLTWLRRAGRWRIRSRTRGAGNPLETVQTDLAGFTNAMERIFPPVGSRLMDLQLKATETAGQTISMAGLLSNDDGSFAVLDDLLLAAQQDRQADLVVTAVEEIQKNAKTIHQATEAVARLVNTFDVLGVMTRIESSRFEAVGGTFLGLADAVAALSLQIREQIRATAESAGVLRRSTARAAEELRAVAQTRRENLGPLTRQISGGLAKVRERRMHVSQANSLLSERFGGVSKAVGDLVVALQSHDIIRQQIEHVVDALRRAECWNHSDSRKFELAKLQAAQLNNSRATFESSVREMRQALERIEGHIREVAGESERLLGSSEAGDASFFDSLQADLRSILGMMQSNAGADDRLREAIVSLEQRITEISRTIAGVYAIGIEMQRIALNAAIQAARLGPDGGALEVVAHAIQGLAQQAETASGAIEDRLDAIRIAVSALGRTAADRTAAQARVAELHRCADVLHCLQDTAAQGETKTRDLITELKRQIRDTIVSFGSEEECLTLLKRGIDTLSDLAAEARSTALADVEQIKSMYTMQSERAVHDELYDADPGSQQLPPAAAVPAVQQDDVEFF